MTTKTVLVVEDDRTSITLIMGFFDHFFKNSDFLRVARNLTEAESIFQIEKESIVAIFVDGCMNAMELNTISLVRYFRQEGFNGPIISIASNPYDRDTMVAAGCDDGLDQKYQAAIYVKKNNLL